MRRWSNASGADEWHVEIENDRFAVDEPTVVSVWVGEGEDEPSVLAMPTPEQAREMATALRRYADLADQANARQRGGP